MTDTKPLAHLSLGPSHPDQWRKGLTCKDCDAHLAERRARHAAGKTVNFNLHRLKNDNAHGYTQHGLLKEIEGTAKAEGRDIQRAGVSWT